MGKEARQVTFGGVGANGDTQVPKTGMVQLRARAEVNVEWLERCSATDKSLLGR